MACTIRPVNKIDNAHVKRQTDVKPMNFSSFNPEHDQNDGEQAADIAIS
ncbi:hypothetical protein [Mahella australiensis]|nr:hypothetical protein [Mahella australiensis]